MTKDNNTTTATANGKGDGLRLVSTAEYLHGAFGILGRWDSSMCCRYRVRRALVEGNIMRARPISRP